MKNARIVVMGGCHVAGYPMGQSDAFPTLLCELLGGKVIKQVANLQFLRIADYLTYIEEEQPSHVILQLGNYEFSASTYHLMRQFKLAFNLSGNTTPNRSSSSKGSSSSSLQTNAVDALPTKGWLDACLRVAGIGAITSSIWFWSSKHRQLFQALNKCIAENPNTTFFFLSPFPCLDPPANTLRRLGGWLFRRGLHKLPNCQWLNTHKVIEPTEHYFADPSHLSKIGHEALAHLLADSFEQHKKAVPQTEKSTPQRVGQFAVESLILLEMTSLLALLY